MLITSFLEKPLAGLLCGLGVAAAGWLLSVSLNSYIASRQTVVVKGLAERVVRADLATWAITFKENGGKLPELQDKMIHNKNTIKTFLTQFNFSPAEMSDSPMSVIDQYSQNYGGQKPLFRYLLQATVILRSEKVDFVKKAMGETGQLINQGIIIDIPQYGPAGEFLFTKLNDIKPDMVKEATEAARAAAIQFAKDSNAAVGNIKSAQQGLFSITDRDTNSPDWKNVRVVNTVEFLIK
jgi:hypothetical protein